MRASIARELRQFRRLVRLSYGRLLDAALASRDIDAEYFVIWGGALLATPLVFYAIRCTSVYASALEQQPQLLARLALADRLFFVIWAMMAAILFVLLIWEGLVPDRTDQQVLGVLPVRSRTVAVARAFTAVLSVTMLVGALSVPGAAIYALGGAVDSSIGFPPLVFVMQVLVSAVAALFTVSVLVTIRVVIVLVVGATVATRIALLLQMVTVIGLLEAFLFLPGLLPALLQPILRSSGETDSWLPPAWFLGLYATVTGPHADLFAQLGRTALAATPLALVGAFAAYVLPAKMNARRAVEARPPKPGLTTATIVSAISKVLRRPAARAVFAFVLVSIARSRRHLLILASYVGCGIAICSLRFISSVASGRPLPIDVPANYSLAMPLVLVFFICAGLRSAFAVPTDLQANWAFRLIATRSTAACVSAVRAVLFLLAVLPTTVLLFAAGWAMWGLAPAVTAALMCAASGAVLTEVSLVDCRSIPFARARAVLSSSLKVRAPLALFGVHVFAFRLDDFQLWALHRRGGVAAYLLAMLVLAFAAGALRRQRSRRPELIFEPPAEGEVLALNLSHRSA